MAKEKKTFVLMAKDGNTWVATSSEFTGTEPAQAASKAARRGVKQIFLRERGVPEKIREYKGTIETKVLKADTPFKKKGEKVQVGKAKYVKIHIIK